jgi:hypothetical protein
MQKGGIAWVDGVDEMRASGKVIWFKQRHMRDGSHQFFADWSLPQPFFIWPSKLSLRCKSGE